MQFRIIYGAVLASYLLVGSSGLENTEATTIQEKTQKTKNNNVQLTSIDHVQLNSNNTVQFSSNSTAVQLNSNKLEFNSNNATKRRVIIVKKEEKDEVKVVKEVKDVKGTLRQKSKKRNRKVKKVKSLLYLELDEDKNKLQEFMMYNLADVSVFFEKFLNVELCINECDD